MRNYEANRRRHARELAPRVSSLNFGAFPDLAALTMFIFFRQSLRGRLLVLVTLVAAALCTMAAVLIWQAYRNERDSIFHELGGTSGSMAAMVDHRLQTFEVMLQGLITAGELEEDNLARFYLHASRMTKPDHFWVAVIDHRGNQIINTHVPFGTRLPPRPPMATIAEAINSNGIYISNLGPSPLREKPVLFITTRVTTRTGVEYYVSVVVSPQEFASGEMLENAPRDHVVALVDRNGIIAARSRNADKFVGRSASPDIAAAARARQATFTRSITVDGQKVLASVSPAKRSGWSIAVGAPLEKLHASARRLATIGLCTSLAILAAATAVAWWIVRAAIHDVTALLDDTRLIAAGTLPPPSSTVLAETRSIAASLHTMAAQQHREQEERLRAQAEITAAKDELARSNVVLEQKVQERTASLAELVQQMEEVTYSLSHDLRAPVRAITTFGQVILEDHADQVGPDARPFLNRMIAGGARLDRMISDLLAFSRVSRQDVHLNPVSLDELLRECVMEHPVLVQHASRIVIEGALPVVLAHRPSLHQVFTNLLTNSVKFVAPGVEPRVRISAEMTGDSAKIWVCDNGIGINPRVQRKLFKLFERVHTDRAYEGTGIGLAIVRRAVERMQGRVGVESDGVDGTRFWVEFRLAPRATVPASPA